jgi:non-ribosomal peptide synthetase component F
VSGPARTAPLSVSQEALWYLARLAPQRLSYNETVSIRKDGPFDAAAFRRAFAELVRRHEAWRTTFDVVDGAPVQVIGDAPAFDLPLLDLGHLTTEQAERRAVDLCVEMSRVPYDLRRGPLVRPRLVRFPAEHHRLYLGLHHLIFDGVSMHRVVLGELVALYDAFAAGRPSPLPDPLAQYADFARWEQEWVAQPRAARRLEAWREHLTPLPELALPRDHPRPPEPRLRGGVVGVTVARTTVERLRAIGDAAGATLFQVLAATWAVLLGRYAGERDVVFATATDLRRRPEFERVVGYCVSPVVLRVDLGGDPSFAELVVRVRNELLDGLDRVLPFERIVREVAPNAAGNVNPIYQTLFVLEPQAVVPDPAWAVVEMEREIGDRVGNAKLDLELQLDERPEGHLAGRLIYDRDLFETATVRRMAVHWSRLVDAVAAEPGLAVSRVPLLTPAEEHRQTVEWNATATDRAHHADAGVLAALAAELALGPADAALVLADAPALARSLALAAGARIVPAPAGTAGDGAALSRLIVAERVSFLCARPATWQALLDTGLRSARALRGLSAGAPLSRALADAILTRCGVLWNAYGGAGLAGCCTLGRVEPAGPISIGRPVANTRAYVVDGHDAPVPVGVTGALVVVRDGGAAPDAEGPFGPGRVWRTGDRARWWPDGRLELVS